MWHTGLTIKEMRSFNKAKLSVRCLLQAVIVTRICHMFVALKHNIDFFLCPTTTF